MGTKIILISAEVSSMLCAILLVWMICFGNVEADEIKAFFISMFIICSVMFQAMQQNIKWK